MYQYWLQKKVFGENIPSVEAMLTQCWEMRQEELGRAVPVPPEHCRLPPQRIARSTHEIIQTQYHCIGASGFNVYHSDGSCKSVWEDIKLLSGWPNVCPHIQGGGAQRHMMESLQFIRSATQGLFSQVPDGRPHPSSEIMVGIHDAQSKKLKMSFG